MLYSFNGKSQIVVADHEYLYENIQRVGTSVDRRYKEINKMKEQPYITKEQRVWRITLSVYSRSAAEVDDIQTALCEELDRYTTETGYEVASFGAGPTEVKPSCSDYAEANEGLQGQ